MADLSITAASVAKGSGAVIDNSALAGASITAGQAVYKDSSNLWQLADANATVLTAAALGIALNNAASGQPLAVQTDGPITIGATVTAGVIYVLSATPGGICPSADISSGWWVTLFGVAISASVIQMRLWASGAQK